MILELENVYLVLLISQYGMDKIVLDVHLKLILI